jgi:hypothetical protein
MPRKTGLATTTTTTTDNRSKEEKKLDEKIAKLEKKMDGTRSTIEKLEIKLEKRRQKKYKCIAEKLTLRKNAKRIERERFIRNYAIRNNAITMYDPWERVNERPLSNVDDIISSLPSDMIGAIANYLGPIELRNLFSVSHVIGKKLTTSFPTLYTSLTVSMQSFIRKEWEVLFTHAVKKLSNVVFNLLPNEVSVIKRITNIRFVLRLLYVNYVNYRHTFTVTNGHRDKRCFTTCSTFLENWRSCSSSQCRFLPLTNGMFLATSIKCNLSKVEDTIKQRDDLYRSPAFLDDTLCHLMDYDDCCDMKLTNLSIFRRDYTETNPRSEIAGWRIVHFDNSSTLVNVNVHSLYEVQCPSSQYANLRLMDMCEVRFYMKIKASDLSTGSPLDTLKADEDDHKKFNDIVSSYVTL